MSNQSLNLLLRTKTVATFIPIQSIACISPVSVTLYISISRTIMCLIMTSVKTVGNFILYLRSTILCCLILVSSYCKISKRIGWVGKGMG